MTFRPSKHPILKWLFPALVLLLTGCVYLVFVYINLFPQLERLQYFVEPSFKVSVEKTDPHLHKASVAEVVGVTTAFHVFFFLFLLSFFRSVLTPPGTIPDIPKWQKGQFPTIHQVDEERLNYLMSTESPQALDIRNPYLLFFLRMFPLVERKKKKFATYRQCQKEGKCKGMWKPDRCHHCAVCDSCVLRMDHHCPWIANCVGFHNYKFFFLLLVYALCCLIFIMAALFPRLLNVFQPILDISYFLRRDLLVLIVYVICLFFFITLAMFFAFHLWLVLHAMTTIEYKEKALVKHLFRVTRVKYDYGYYQNLVHVLGPPYMWFLPIAPPAIHFLSLQRQYLLSISRQADLDDSMSVSNTDVALFEAQAKILADQLDTPKAKQDALQDVGCYYTPYAAGIQLWHLAYESKEERARRMRKKKVRLRTSDHEEDNIDLEAGIHGTEPGQALSPVDTDDGSEEADELDELDDDDFDEVVGSGLGESLEKKEAEPGNPV